MGIFQIKKRIAYLGAPKFAGLLLMLLVLLLAGNGSQAQADARLHSVKGTVVDANTSLPVYGASVLIKRNRPAGAVTTNKQGRFEMKAGAGDVLLITFIGYLDLELPVSAVSAEAIPLTPVTNEMEEVVVIGYGTVKKGDVTGSLSQVDLDDLNKAPVASFDQALAGRVPGVQVTSDDGQPGSEMNIIVRGGNSLTQSNAPLYVVDGFPVEDFTNASLNPEDIASITVLKDASATAIYGSRGANGVVIIETKGGKVSKPAVSYNGYVGTQSILKKMEMMDSYEYVRFLIDRDSADLYPRYITKRGRTLEDYKSMDPIQWQDLLFAPSYMQSHWLSLRGGDARTKYAVSTSLFDQDGIVINSGYGRYQGRLSLSQEINKKLKASVNLNYSHDKNFGGLASEQGAGSNSYSTYLMYQAWASSPVLLDSSADIHSDLFVDEGEDDETVRLMNPLISTRNMVRQQVRSNLMVNVKIDYDISRKLTFTARGGISRRLTRNESFYNSKTYQGYPYASNLKGVNGSYSDAQLNNWMNENMLYFKQRFKNGNRLDATAGVSIQGTLTNTYGYSVYNLVREEMGLAGLKFGEPASITARRSKNMLASYLARVDYSIQSKYLFTASLRADGSSKFSGRNRWGYFPSGAFAWHMVKESFMKNIKVISDAKLRLSYGVTGNNRVGDFVRYSSIDIVSGYYSFNNEIPSYASRFSNLGSDDLRWETTSQVNIGYDLALFKNRISLTADVYSKTTDNLLLNADLPTSTGFTSMYRNVGKIKNEGLELSVTSQNFKTADFSWESSFNISFNRNRVVALSNDQNVLLSRVSWTNNFNSSNLYIAGVGASASNFFGFIWDGNYQYSDFDQHADGSYTLKNNIATNGAVRTLIKPGDIKYRDINGDKIVNDDDRVIIGRALPVHIGGFNNNFSYKGFSLNAFFQWSYGNDIFNANRLAFEGNFGNKNINQYATYINRWTDDNQSNEYFRIGGQGPAGMYSSRTIEDGSYLRLKTVQLSYHLPQPVTSKLGMKSVRVYMSGQNLFTWTNYSGMDPEVSVRNSTLTPGFDYSAYPRVRTVTFGINADF